MAQKPGDVVGGRYTLLEVIGEGGQGAVFRARDENFGSIVAVKCLHAEIAAEPGFKTRMQREAMAMGALSGTSAAQVYAFDKIEGGGMFLAMEYVAGRDLETYLRQLEKHGSHISVARLAELLGPVVETLETAHGLGILHRDLKPANIMVLDSLSRGPVRLLDFGLAKDLKADPLTMDGMIAGSPSYMAPEIWKGKPDQLDHRIDVYSLGAIVFRALAGRPPFDATQPIDKLLIAVLRAPRPSLHAVRPDLPEAVDGWVKQALAVKPDDRFPTVRALWSEFLKVMSHELARR